MANDIIPFSGSRYRPEHRLAEAPAEKKPPDWLVQEFGRPCYNGDRSEWELSVCRVDNEHGQCSYGWAGWNKIILSDAIGQPTRQTVVLVRKLATYLCSKLNGEI